MDSIGLTVMYFDSTQKNLVVKLFGSVLFLELGEGPPLDD